jgi:hypothetical protein
MHLSVEWMHCAEDTVSPASKAAASFVLVCTPGDECYTHPPGEQRQKGFH